jgi:hypothetical protein
MVMPVKRTKFNFIRLHLIKEIFQRSSEKKKICQVPENSFIYFDEPIQTTHFKINRFGKGNFFFEEQVLPIDWTSIDGIILLKAVELIKTNKFFVLKDVDGKFYKAKPKGKNVRK